MADAEWCHANWYVIYPVALLPHLERDSFDYAEPQRSNNCMRRGMPLWERLGRQVVRKRPLDCCYYHSVEWRTVAGEAVRIARAVPLAAQMPPWWADDDSDEAEQAYERAWQPHDDARDLAAACGLPERERKAVRELLSSSDSYLAASPGRQFVTGLPERAAQSPGADVGRGPMGAGPPQPLLPRNRGLLTSTLLLA